MRAHVLRPIAGSRGQPSLTAPSVEDDDLVTIRRPPARSMGSRRGHSRSFTSVHRLASHGRHDPLYLLLA